MADKVHISRESPGPARESSGEGSSHQFGLTAAMALIVGSIIGVGAVYGPITLVSTTALAFSLLFIVYSRNTAHSVRRFGRLLLARRRPAARHPRLPGTAPSCDQPAPVPPHRDVERGG